MEHPTDGHETSEIENNRRDEIAELIRRKSEHGKRVLLILAVVVLLFCLLGAVAGFGERVLGLGASCGAGALLLILIIVLLARALPSKIERMGLDSIRRGKQSAAHNFREDATRIATKNALIGVGVLAAKTGLGTYHKL